MGHADVGEQVFPSDPYEYLVKNAQMTRIDIAVDFLNVNVNELLFSGKGKGKSIHYHSTTGDLETLYVDKPKKKKSKKYMYDKYQEQLDEQEAQPDEPDSFLHGNAPSTRVEFSHQGTKFYKLKNIHNVCKRATVFHPHKPNLNMEPRVWTLFVECCRSKGLNKALPIIPEEYRAQCKELIEASSDEIWKPKTLWEGWADYIDQLGILEPLKG